MIVNLGDIKDPEETREGNHVTSGLSRNTAVSSKKTTSESGLLAREKVGFGCAWSQSQLPSRTDVPKRQPSRKDDFGLRQADITPQLRRQVLRQLADLPPSPVCADECNKQLPRTEVFQKIVHPLVERHFN